MEQYIYSSAGKPLGFHDGSVIYDVHGHPVGQLHGSHAYTIQGHYVGELDDCMIVDKNQNYASVGARGVASRGVARNSESRWTRNKLSRHFPQIVQIIRLPLWR
jgi:sporulation protein YlmC with PRC-barrel domain